jgi:hypothetical protein
MFMVYTMQSVVQQCNSTPDVLGFNGVLLLLDLWLQESENVELRPTLLKACKDERQMFCKNVIPGGARLFRWEENWGTRFEGLPSYGDHTPG